MQDRLVFLLIILAYPSSRAHSGINAGHGRHVASQPLSLERHRMWAGQRLPEEGWGWPWESAAAGVHRPWLALRGGGSAVDDTGSGMLCSDFLHDNAEIPWGESGTQEEMKADEERRNTEDMDETADAGELHEMLSCWQDALVSTAGGALPPGDGDSVSGTGRVGFWQGHGLARCSALYCEAEELLRGPAEEARDPCSLLLWLQMQAAEVVKRVSVPAAKTRRQQALLANLSAAVADIWGPAAVLTPYGSAAAGYGTVESDLDLQLSLGEEWDTKMANKVADGRVTLQTCMSRM